MLRRLVKANAKISVGVQQEVHSGVLPDQVLAAARQADDCKLRVLDILTNAIYDGASNGGGVQTTYGPNSPIIGKMSGGTININDK